MHGPLEGLQRNVSATNPPRPAHRCSEKKRRRVLRSRSSSTASLTAGHRQGTQGRRCVQWRDSPNRGATGRGVYVGVQGVCNGKHVKVACVLALQNAASTLLEVYSGARPTASHLPRQQACPRPEMQHPAGAGAQAAALTGQYVPHSLRLLLSFKHAEQELGPAGGMGVGDLAGGGRVLQGGERPVGRCCRMGCGPVERAVAGRRQHPVCTLEPS